ncbi:AAA family ATPase [Enterobacter mori]|uniref:AAA family ATPase n=1 Tax=Enterobacter mori TaxID=539813 RepID=UPI001BE11EB4|nr:AAA family ATPase [Enterobacter mori]MBT1869344.1 AAA family ATPase [Enterobacter mori]
MINKMNLEHSYVDFLELEARTKNEDYLKDSIEIHTLESSLNRSKFHLNKIGIHDFKRIRELQITLEDDLTVFVGDNGFGKSTILESIAIALSWLRSNIEKEGKPGTYIKNSEINNSSDVEYSSIDVNIKLKDFNTGILITKSKDGAQYSRNNELKEIKKLASIYRLVNKYVDNASLPLMVYYSIARSNIGGGLDKKRKNSKIKSAWSKFDVYDEIEFDRNDFADFFQWLVFLYNRAAQEKLNDSQVTINALISDIENIKATLFQLSTIIDIDDTVIRGLEISLKEKTNYLNELKSGAYRTNNSISLYEKVISTILTFLPEFQWIKLVYGDDDYKIVLKKGTSELDIQQLSQGEKTILTLVGDLARRLILLNPKSDNPLLGYGIVLIDEIDLHLHPQWQQTIIERLTSTFPNVQFVVTTHSPQVLSTVNSRSVRILQEIEDDGFKDLIVSHPDYQIKGVSNKDALLYGMKTDPVPSTEENYWLESYEKLVELNDYNSPAALELREKIVNHFGSEHPLIQKCDDLISVLEFKNKINKRLSENKGMK